MKYKCETCGEAFEGCEKSPSYGTVIYEDGICYHMTCANLDRTGIVIRVITPSKGKLILEFEEIKTPNLPEEIQRLHESADRVGLHIYELQASIDADNEDAQAMATAAIKREVERCRKLLGEIEAEYLPVDKIPPLDVFERPEDYGFGKETEE